MEQRRLLRVGRPCWDLLFFFLVCFWGMRMCPSGLVFYRVGNERIWELGMVCEFLGLLFL